MTNLHQTRADALQGRLQERFAAKATAYLSEGATDLPYDISERLRAGRMQAVAKRKISKLQTATAVNGVGSSSALTWGASDGLSWWGRLGSVLPLVALVVGLLTINSVQDDNRVQEIAEVDAALLTDDLPPAAFSDPGFIQFLRTNL